MTTGPLTPSRFKRGSYLPGPHELYTAFCPLHSAGDTAAIATGLRSELGRPSRRDPIPGAKELLTVEWQRAQVVPTRTRVSRPPMVSTVPLSPTTPSSLRRATVVAGSVRLIAPLWIPCTNSVGSASPSTLSPT